MAPKPPEIDAGSNTNNAGGGGGGEEDDRRRRRRRRPGRGPLATVGGRSEESDVDSELESENGLSREQEEDQEQREEEEELEEETTQRHGAFHSLRYMVGIMVGGAMAALLSSWTFLLLLRDDDGGGLSAPWERTMTPEAEEVPYNAKVIQVTSWNVGSRRDFATANNPFEPWLSTSGCSSSSSSSSVLYEHDHDGDDGDDDERHRQKRLMDHYEELLLGIHDYLDLDESDVFISTIFTTDMMQDLVVEMENAVLTAESPTVTTTASTTATTATMSEDTNDFDPSLVDPYWQTHLQDKRVVSDFLREANVDAKSDLWIQPHRKTSTIPVVLDPAGGRSGGREERSVGRRPDSSSSSSSSSFAPRTVRTNHVYRPTVANPYDGDLSSVEQWWKKWLRFMFQERIWIRDEEGDWKANAPFQLLQPLGRDEYPNLSEAERNVSIQLLYCALYDCIMVHMMNVMSSGWQSLKRELVDRWIHGRLPRIVRLLERSSSWSDIMTLQNATSSLLSALSRSDLLRNAYHLRWGGAAEGPAMHVHGGVSSLLEHDYFPVVLLKKERFLGGSIVNVTDKVAKLLSPNGGGGIEGSFGGSSVLHHLLVVRVRDRYGKGYVVVSYADAHDDEEYHYLENSGTIQAAATSAAPPLPSTPEVLNAIMTAIAYDDEMQNDQFILGMNANTYGRGVISSLSSSSSSSSSFASAVATASRNNGGSSPEEHCGSVNSSNSNGSAKREISGTPEASADYHSFGMGSQEEISSAEDSESFTTDSTASTRSSSQLKFSIKQFLEECSLYGLETCWKHWQQPAVPSTSSKRAGNYTTFSAGRTGILQSLWRKGSVATEGKVTRPHTRNAHLKDFILFNTFQYEVQSTWKDNTGNGEFEEHVSFPTLQFPSDHAIVSTILRPK